MGVRELPRFVGGLHSMNWRWCFGNYEYVNNLRNTHHLCWVSPRGWWWVQPSCCQREINPTTRSPPNDEATASLRRWRGLDHKQLTTTSCTAAPGQSVVWLHTLLVGDKEGRGLSRPDGSRHPSLPARYRPEVVRGSTRGTYQHTRLLPDWR